MLATVLAFVSVAGCGGPDAAELRTLDGRTLGTDGSGGAVLALGERIDVQGELVYEGRTSFEATVITSNRPDVVAVQRLTGESFRLMARAPGSAALELSFSAQGKATVSVVVVAEKNAGR
jgi:hypothetical protein